MYIIIAFVNISFQNRQKKKYNKKNMASESAPLCNVYVYFQILTSDTYFIIFDVTLLLIYYRYVNNIINTTQPASRRKCH